MVASKKDDDLKDLESALEEEETEPKNEVDPKDHTEDDGTDAGDLDEEKESEEEGEEDDELSAALKAENERPAPNLQIKREEPSGSSRSSSSDEETSKKEEVPEKPSKAAIIGKAFLQAYSETSQSPEVVEYRAKKAKERAKQGKAKKKAKKAALDAKNKRREHAATLGPIRGRIWYWFGDITPTTTPKGGDQSE